MKLLPKLLLFLMMGSLSAAEPSIYPPALKKGDLIAVIAPASSPIEDQRAITEGLKDLVKKGYRVRMSPNVKTKYGYLAGTDQERAKAFMDVWKDPEVKAVWCYRGGYGCARMLDLLDFQAIKRNPKILIGMSDITALHAAISKKTGIVTFLGPNVNAVFGPDKKNRYPYNERELWSIISTNARQFYQYKNPARFPLKGHKFSTLRSGVARGKLAGGNLSLVASLIGTPWEIETEGKILVLEEVNEEPFRIDRMLQQLKQAGLLDRPAAVVLCSWKGCHTKKPAYSLSLDKVFEEYFSKAPYPVLLGFPSGHINEQVTLPIHSMAELDANRKTLRLLEKPVQ